MSRKIRPTTRLILLAPLLAAGPLKASAVFACEMMQTVVYEVCCCDEAMDARDDEDASNCDDAMSAMAEPCCEHSSAVSFDGETFKAPSVSKPPGKSPLPQFDLDPADAGIAESLSGELQSLWSPGHRRHAAAVAKHYDGSSTWLTTRRLRI